MYEMKNILKFFLVVMFLSSPLLKKGAESSIYAQTHYVMIETNMGNMKVMLYDDTPLTTANFLEKVKSGYYDETLFGRVIEGFMIQGGAPDSRTAGPGQSIGWGDINEEIPGEIRKNHIPKKGALAAPHRVNMKNSDMSMFFIVQGYAKPRDYWLDCQKNNTYEIRKAAKKKVVTKAIADSLKLLKPDDYSPAEQKAKYNELARRINQQVDSIARATPGARFFSEEELDAYSTVGGSYHLYMEYTIYGQVVEGLEVIDKIAALETNAADRPRTDVRMRIRVIK